MRWWIPGALAAAFGALAVAPRPAVDNTVQSMLVDHSPAAERYRAFQRQFGTDDVIVAQVAAPDGEGSPLPVMQRAAALERALAGDPLVAGTLGPATAFEEELDLLGDPALGGPDALSRLRPRFEGPLARLQVVVPEARRATVFAFLPLSPPEERARVEDIIEAQRDEAEAEGLSLRAAGNPLLNLALDRAGREVEATAIPLLVGVCVVVLLLTTRRVGATVAALVPAALGVLAAQGALGLSGASTNIIVNIAWPLIFVLILATGLHVVVAWQDLRREGLDPDEAPARAARSKAKACALALGTTAMGFGSLMVSDLEAIRRFGVVSAGALLAGIPLVLVVLPAALRLLGRRGKAPPDRDPARGLASGLVAHALRRGPLYPALGIAAVLAGGLAALELTPDPHALNYFPADHPLRADHEAIEAAGLGLFTVEAVVSGPELTSRDTLEALDAFARETAQRPGVEAWFGLPLLARAANWRATRQDAIPVPKVLDELLDDRERLRQVLTPDGEHLRLSFLIDQLDADAVEALHADLRARLPEGLEVSLTGNYGLLLRAQRGMLQTLRDSLLLTALLMELVFIFALRSLRRGLVALVPNALPVCVNFGLMWLVGIPLDVGTSMTAAVALGIAVDDTLHFTVGWRPETPLVTARGAGRAIAVSSVVVAAGFFALTSSDFAPTARFGLLCGAAMISALLADLLVLPPLLKWLDRRP